MFKYVIFKRCGFEVFDTEREAEIFCGENGIACEEIEIVEWCEECNSPLEDCRCRDIAEAEHEDAVFQEYQDNIRGFNS
jgi:hypothetical protein